MGALRSVFKTGVACGQPQPPRHGGEKEGGVRVTRPCRDAKMCPQREFKCGGRGGEGLGGVGGWWRVIRRAQNSAGKRGRGYVCSHVLRAAGKTYSMRQVREKGGRPAEGNPGLGWQLGGTCGGASAQEGEGNARRWQREAGGRTTGRHGGVRQPITERETMLSLVDCSEDGPGRGVPTEIGVAGHQEAASKGGAACEKNMNLSQWQVRPGCHRRGGCRW